MLRRGNQANLFVLFARSRGSAMLVAASAVMVVICWLVPTELSLNPFNSSVSVILFQLPALAVGIFWPLMAVSSLKEMESAVPQVRLRWLRGGWLATAALALTGSGVAVFLIRLPDLWQVAATHARNGLLGCAIGSLSAILLPKQAAWVPAATVLGVCWLAGTTDSLGTPAAWAFPCYPADSVVAGVLVLALWASASSAYILRSC